MSGSLRWRLVAGTTLVSAVTLACLSAAIDDSIRSTLTAEFDRVLLEKARSLASMVDQHHDDLHFDYQRPQFPEFEAGPHAAYFEVMLRGRTFQRSPSLAKEGVPLITPPLVEGKVSAVTLPNQRQGRRLLLAFRPNMDEEDLARQKYTPAQGLLAVALDTADLDRTLSRVRLTTWSLCGLATVITGAALFLVVGRAVKPIRALADRIESLRETDLSAVLDAGKVPAELAPVVERLNGLLRRLSEAFARERAFTADVAHELRTPLAGLLATLEVCRARPRDAAGYQGAIDQSLGMLTRMQCLVENLLLLARADSGQLKLRAVEVDLASLVHDCWFAFQEPARRRELSLRFEENAAAAPAALADPDFLPMVFNNLFDNAISYAQAATDIVVRVQQEAAGDRVTIEFLNTGHMLTAEDLPRLAERFWRKDTARTGTGLHAGLGLSLCQRLMTLQRGSLSLRVEGEKFVAAITLPGAGREAEIRAACATA